jgi:hypothetical protein
LTEISHDAFRDSERREKIMIEKMKGIKKTASFLYSRFWTRTARRSGVPLI